MKTSAAPQSVSPPPEQEPLLTTVRLRLSASVRRTSPHPLRVVVRRAGNGRRLVLTKTQDAILSKLFAEPRTVPVALAILLGQRDDQRWSDYSCPPLAEYYELVLQACAAGVLVDDAVPDPAPPASSWPLPLPLGFARFLGGGLFLAGIATSLYAVFAAHWTTPHSVLSLVAGWLLACAALSAGELLGACAIAGGKGEVLGCRLRWRTLFPQVRIDSAEAVIGGGACERAVALLRAAPAAGALAVVALRWPVLAVPVFAGVFYALAPWRGTAAAQWLAARRGLPRLTVELGFLFEPRRRDVLARINAWLAADRADFGRLGLAWTIVWLALVATAFATFWPDAARSLVAGLRRFGLPAGLIYVLGALVVVALVLLVLAKLRQRRLRHELIQPLRSKIAHTPGGPLQGEDIATMLGQVPLFAKLPKLDRMAIAADMKLVNVKAGEIVCAEDMPGVSFYVVVDGELEVQKRQPAPAQGFDTIGRLGPGDSFGEIALLEDTPRTATVRTTRPCRLLRLAKADFMKLVATHVGPARVREYLQYAVFLGRMVFAANWPFEDLVRFAQTCTSARYNAGNYITRKGEANIWFNLVFDGAFEVRENGHAIRRLGPGDYFGEISILEHGQATADIVALEESRCLTMARNEFLGFIAHDYRVNLRMEALIDERRGRPLFVSR